MDEKEFNTLAEATLAQIEDALDRLDEDLDYQLKPGGILEIEFEDGAKIIINRHSIAREIWVAHRSGGFHFHRVANQWVDTRDGTELKAKLSALFQIHGIHTINW